MPEMRMLFKGAAAAIALSTLAVGSAEAQLAPSVTGPLCGVATPGMFNPPYAECAGSFDGNNTGNAATRAAVLGEIAAQGWLTEAYEAEGVGSFNGTPGTITFSSTYSNFVLALKQGNYFSLYYFTESANEVQYSTAGTKPGATTGLSHWTLYAGRETIVPEPGTLLLMGTGLLGMAFVRRREDVA